MSATPHRSWRELRRNTFQRRTALLRELARRPSAVLGPRRYVFVLSHMRSRSTLLMHLLGSHPEISGHLETHIRYRRRRDFQKLRIMVSSADTQAPLGRIVADKILHRSYVDLRLLKRMEVVPIFLLRRPEEAIPSIRRWARKQGFEQATHHYVRQLQWITAAAQTLPDGIFIPSESLVEDPGTVLAMIEDRLELAEPLREDYRIFPATGRARLGDPSKSIRTGRIVKDIRRRYTKAGPVPPALLDRGRDAHRRCLAALQRCCPSVAGAPRAAAGA